MMISASMDSTLRVWSLPEKALVRVLTGHWVGVTALGLSRNGRWLISGGGRARVLVHDLSQDFALKQVIRQPHDSRVERVLMLPDGVHFVTVDQNGKSFIWNLSEPVLKPVAWLADQECLREAEGGDAEGGKVAVLCSGGEVRIMGSTGDPRDPLVVRPARSRIAALAIAPDGHWLALGTEDGTILLRDLKSGVQTEQKVAEGSIVQLSFSRRGVLAAAHEGGVKVFALGKGLSQNPGTQVSDQPARALSFSTSGRSLAIASDHQEVSVWDVQGERPARNASLPVAQAVSFLTYTGDDHLLLVGSVDGSLSIQATEPASGPLRRIASNRSKVLQVELAPGRRYVVARNELNQAQLWDSRDRTCVRLPGYWSSAVFQDDATLVLSAASDPESGDKPGGWIARMDLGRLPVDRAFFARSAPGFTVPENSPFEALALSPDRKRLAATVSDAAVPLVCVWDLKTGKLTHWLSQIQDPVRSMSFSSDGRRLATAGDSPSARLWELDASGGEIKNPDVTFSLPDAANVTCVRIRPGASRQLVTGHSDGRAILWSWRDSKATPVQTHLVEEVIDGAVRAMIFTPNGRYLAVAGDGTTIWLGELEPRPRPLGLKSTAASFRAGQYPGCLARWIAAGQRQR